MSQVSELTGQVLCIVYRENLLPERRWGSKPQAVLFYLYTKWKWMKSLEIVVR